MPGGKRGNNEVDIIEEDEEYVVIRCKKRRTVDVDDMIDQVLPLVTPPPRPVNFINHNEWISPSKLRNYLHGDPLLDWLDRHGEGVHERAGFRDGNNAEATFMEFIRQKGIEFERRVMELIQTSHPDCVHQVSTGVQDVCNPAKYRETTDLITKGVPIIYQGVLHDAENKYFGCPDLLIRNDYLQSLIPGAPMPPPRRKPRDRSWSHLIPSHYYFVVDIKFMTLPLRANAVGLLNSGSIPFYKTQLTMYNEMLAKIQGWKTPYGYLLGRGYTYTKCGENYAGDSCFAKLGVIDFQGSDYEYLAKMQQAVEWVKRLRAHGRTWQVLPVPSVPELYPNMSNSKDHPHHGAKEYLAKELREITLLWGCGLKHRQTAFRNKIFRFDDKRLTAKLLGFNGPVQSRIVQTMLEFNRDDVKKLVRPDVIMDNRCGWQDPDRLEFYVDFETVSNVFDDLSALPRIGGRNMIFMVGVGWKCPIEHTWTYKSFVATALTKPAERDIIDGFLKYISEVIDQYDINYQPNVYHWSRCEPIQLMKALEEHAELTVYTDFNFVDLLGIFKDETILIKGVFDFSIKSVAKGLSQHNLIPDVYTGAVTGGSDAMLRAVTCYKTAASRGVDICTLVQFRHIITYNEVDCRVMEHIIEYLRQHHSKNSHDGEK